MNDEHAEFERLKPQMKLEHQLERAMEFIYAVARTYGNEMNLLVKNRYLEETTGKDILIEWEYLGDPGNPDPDDELVATVLLGGD